VYEASAQLCRFGGCVGPRSAEKDATANQEGSSGIVEELRAIICPKTTHKISELCVSVSYELDNMLVNFGFMAQRKSPTVMCKIINYHKIIFITRDTQNWGGRHHNEGVQMVLKY
jgi:hypothetical protein